MNLFQESLQILTEEIGEILEYLFCQTVDAICNSTD
jgi:hypothetical protein